jgi:hypothetical protein
MGNFDRLWRGWELALRTFRVIEENKSLLIFPLLSGASLALIVASFLSAVGGIPTLESVNELKVLDYADLLVLLFTFYLINSIIIIFFNMGLVRCLLKILAGEKADIPGSLLFACRRITSVLLWAIVSAVVGTLLKSSETRDKIFGGFMSGIFGMVWALATFFVIPSMVAEDLGVAGAIQRSSMLFKRTWGERIGATFSFTLVWGVVFFAAAFIMAFFLLNISKIAFVIGLIVVGSCISCLTSTAETIFMTQAYRYAVGQSKDPEFNDIFKK